MTDALRERLQQALGTSHTIDRELGGGGMSRVFVATEHAFGRSVVVKVLPSDAAAQVSLERFTREIQVAARLQHPHIVPLLSAGDADGVPYFTMPFVEGESLRARLDQRGELPVNEAVRLLREVASALGYAHDRGIVHRDIKPDNVLVSAGSAMVTDFGVAKALSASSDTGAGMVTSLGVALGTPAYMAPEQASADPNVDHRADLYAFGAMAYELLSGQPPFTGRSAQGLLAAHVTEAPESLGRRRAALPPALVALVMRCLEKRPADRPQSALEIVRALDDIASPSGGIAPTMAHGPAPSATATAAPVVARRRLLPAIVALTVLVLAAAVWQFRGAGAAAVGTSTKGDAALAKSVAVLTLVNAAGDTANAYFAQGMTDEVTVALARVPGLRVASRNSALSIDVTKPVDVRDVAERLNVGTVLEGQMRRSGTQFRVTMQLTNAADGLSLWSGTFDGDMKDMFAVQERIARAIAEALRVQLTGDFRVAGGTANVDAHDLVLRAQFLSDEYTQASLREAIALFERATQLDEQYVDAWAGLAQAWFYMGDDYMPAKDAVVPGRVALARALALDSLNPSVLVSLGTDQYYYRRQRPQGIATLRRALAIDSLNESAMIFLALMLRESKQGKEAAELTLRLDRRNPSSRLRFRYMTLNRALVEAGYVHAAEEVCRRARDVDQQRYGPCSHWLLRYQNKLAEALVACRAFTPPPSICGAQILGKLGRQVEASAEALLLEARLLQRAAKTGYTDPWQLALTWANVGDRERAMRWLLVTEHDVNGALRPEIMSEFAFMNGYPPFEALRRRVGAL
ncbi:serine/threonine-protein kinase [Gemmatimonas groenlandica]|uniref:non-specific serine/threonine protein kinase n=1 Tax=Gemmatimonas groenlandica TaxID=2732249 RepID=A0A6M4IW19_9BACT|nr:serine/threonine-protein kinase [Gemmatimonas groenlandica]QJR37909.1 protein kinase [Gemmatimonas groenlandica]